MSAQPRKKGAEKFQVLQNEGKFLNAQSLSPVSSKNAIQFSNKSKTLPQWQSGNVLLHEQPRKTFYVPIKSKQLNQTLGEEEENKVK